MNLIQKEMLLKAARLGCTVEAADADSPLEVKKDGKDICTIHSDKMTFKRWRGRYFPRTAHRHLPHRSGIHRIL